MALGTVIKYNTKNTMPKALRGINLSMNVCCSCSNDITASYVDLYDCYRFCSMYSENINVPVM